MLPSPAPVPAAHSCKTNYVWADWELENRNIPQAMAMATMPATLPKSDSELTLANMINAG